MDFVPHTEQDIKAMMDFLGIKSIDELFDDIPDKFKISSVGIDEGKSELDLFKKVFSIAHRNRYFLLSLSGCGIYYHYVPAVCDFASSLPGFFTSYTPYQAEMSQGVLRLLFEYQSAVAELFGMDVSNAGMYGGASALAEACLMALRITKKNKIYVSSGVNPMWLETVRSYTNYADIDMELIPLKNGKTNITNHLDVLVIQYPNFFGVVEDLELARENSSFLIVAVPDPIDVAYITPPGKFSADVVVSEGQPLGNYPFFGGSTLGIFLTKKGLIRSMPGRLIGETVDKEGKTCYCMILQTREQHIRREKAVSNICTATTLLAIRAVTFMKYYGGEGLQKISELSFINSLKLREKIKPIFNAEYFKEFPAYVDIDEEKFVNNGILPPVRVSKVLPKFLDEKEFELLTQIEESAYVFCTTEIFSDQDIKHVLSLL